MLPLCQERSRQNNGREKKKTDIFRPRATALDRRGAEAFLKTSDKEQRETIFGI